MMDNFITYQNKKYEITEPTIEQWSKLMALQEWTEEQEFAVKLLSFVTGLSEVEIENSDYEEILQATNKISATFLNESKKFRNEFEFNGKKYKFLDLPNLTFGEFVDIDSFLSKPANEKKTQLNLLMAMLYREVDKHGMYVPYDSRLIPIKAEEFKKLPVKYVNGASSFFLRLGKISQGSLRISLWNRMKIGLRMTWMLVKSVALISIGVGWVRFSNWLTRISRRQKK
jgi:hypothetical protein